MRKLSVVFIGVIAMMLVACGSDEPAAKQHFSVEAKTVWFDTLEEMEEYSELIVKVERLGKEETMVKTVNGEMVSGFTFSEVEIKEIYEDKEQRYQIGDKITILENEVYNESENIVYHIADYNMMVVGNEYLLFLDYSVTDGTEYYVASGVNLGTISLEEDDRQKTYKNRMGNETGDYSIYQDMWTEAIDKYIN